MFPGLICTTTQIMVKVSGVPVLSESPAGREASVFHSDPRDFSVIVIAVLLLRVRGFAEFGTETFTREIVTEISLSQSCHPPLELESITHYSMISSEWSYFFLSHFSSYENHLKSTPCELCWSLSSFTQIDCYSEQIKTFDKTKPQYRLVCPSSRQYKTVSNGSSQHIALNFRYPSSPRKKKKRKKGNFTLHFDMFIKTVVNLPANHRFYVNTLFSMTLQKVGAQMMNQDRNVEYKYTKTLFFALIQK